MSICVIVGQDKQSRLTHGTKKELQKIMQYLVAQKGVSDFYVMGNNEFEIACCIDLMIYCNFKFKCNYVLRDAPLLSGASPQKIELKLLGKWAYYSSSALIPPSVIEKATTQLIEMADYIIVGSKYTDDLVAAAEYGRELGKTIFRVYA